MGKIRTIIVDDEARIHRGIERIVRSCGDDWEVVGTFADGIEVIEFLQETQAKVDLLITDVKMPEMDGLTLIKEIKLLNPERYVSSVIVSGYDDFQFLQTAIREGANDYVLKPIDRAEFIKLLDKIKLNIEEQRMKDYKWNDLVKQSDKLTLSKQTQLLREALQSGPDDLALMYWVKDFPEGLYQLLYISTDEFPYKTREYTPNDWGAMSYAVENIVDEVLMNYIGPNEYKLGWWWRESGFHFWMLLHTSNKDENTFFNKVSDFSNVLRSSISQYTPFTFTIAQSDSFEDISVLPDVRKQLLSLIRMRILNGGNQVYSVQTVNKTKIRESQSTVKSDIREIVNKLVTILGQEDFVEIEDVINQFLKKITELGSSSEIEYTIQYFIVHMYKKLMEEHESGILFNELDELFEAVKEETNINRLKFLIKNSYLQVHNKLISYNKEHRQDPVSIAKTWINEHLGEKITINDVSELVYMNPTYFCQYFKRQTGKTILDYLTDQRMIKAKEMLLQDTNSKVTEISQKLGYSDTKYFSRLFKSKWGSLPSEYKSKKLYNHNN